MSVTFQYYLIYEIGGVKIKFKLETICVTCMDQIKTSYVTDRVITHVILMLIT